MCDRLNLFGNLTLTSDSTADMVIQKHQILLICILVFMLIVFVQGGGQIPLLPRTFYYIWSRYLWYQVLQ